MSEDARILDDDTVCACFDETGERKTRLYERCLRCGSLMEADYLAERLEFADRMEALLRRQAIAGCVVGHGPCGNCIGCEAVTLFGLHG